MVKCSLPYFRKTLPSFLLSSVPMRFSTLSNYRSITVLYDVSMEEKLKLDIPGCWRRPRSGTKSELVPGVLVDTEARAPGQGVSEAVREWRQCIQEQDGSLCTIVEV